MTRPRPAVIGAIVLATACVSALVIVGVQRFRPPPVATPGTTSVTTAAATPGRKIKAQLFYVGADGSMLTSVERDVAYGEQTLDQAREILTAQILQPESPLVSAVPAGTALRALFVTGQGEAFVDLSRDVAAAHPGGSLNELLTIYTIVDALTLNLPAITSVQLLVDGKEVDTLAGHIDLRRPLTKNLDIIQQN
jgi:spore germination protein GerM